MPITHRARNMERWSLYHTAPRRVEVRQEAAPSPGVGEVTVRSVISAISAGTEMLFYRGLVGEGTPLDETITSIRSQLRYPYKYGYATVGVVEGAGEGVPSSWLGREVFCFHPHESFFTVPLPEVRPVPPGVTLEDAALFPGVETALSLAMDAAPIVGENVAVLGQGVIGLLTTAILSRMPLGHLVAADRYDLRRERSLGMGAEACVDPSGGPHQFLEDVGLAGNKVDLVIELSGNPEGLEFATRIAALEGRIIVGSWYGTSPHGCCLGDEFHRQRLRIISSQVSRISGDLSSRWSKERRAETTWRIIRQVSPSQLITHRFPLADASSAYRLLDESGHKALQVLLTYPEA